MKNQVPLISVVIPTLNNASLLDKALSSIKDQSLSDSDFEIIVVDNGSIDDTAKVCDKWAISFENFYYVYEENPGLHAGRNLGLKLAKADLIVYIDDDVYTTPRWLQSILEVFKDENVGLVGGNNYPNFETPPPQWLQEMKTPYSDGWYLSPLSILDFGKKTKEINSGFVWGCNYSVRKIFLETIGGFHPDGMPDRLLHLRGDGESFVSAKIAQMGKKVLFCSEASVFHYVPAKRMTLEYLKKRGYRQGISKSYSVIRKFKGINISSLMILFLIMLKSLLLMPLRSNKGNKSILKGYVKGILWHIIHCKNNPETIEWILKKDYL